MKELKLLLLLYGGIFHLAESILSSVFGLDDNNGDPVKCSISSMNPTLSKSCDMSDIKFHVWKKGDNRTYQYFELHYGNETEAKELNYGGRNFSIVFFFHNIGDNGKAEWILNSSDAFLKEKYNDNIIVISPNFDYLVPNKVQAMRKAEAIASHSSVVLNWAFNISGSISSSTCKIFIGHGLGANISFSAAQKMQNLSANSFTPTLLTALDPYIAKPSELSGLPASSVRNLAIKKNMNFYIIVYHTSTCSQTTVIPACDSNSSETLGDTDFFANDGATQPGCSTSDSGCSNMRAVYLFLEEANSVYDSSNSLYSFGCPSYEKFHAGNCTGCLFNCLVMTGLTQPDYKGRFYCPTNAISIYGKGENSTF